MRRTIELTQISSLVPDDLVNLLTSLEGLRSLFDRGWTSVDEGKQPGHFRVTVGQDHYIDLYIQATSSDFVLMRQVWMDKEEVEIHLEFYPLERGTKVKVYFVGDISGERERDYLDDWSDLEFLP